MAQGRTSTNTMIGSGDEGPPPSGGPLSASSSGLGSLPSSGQLRRSNFLSAGPTVSPTDGKGTAGENASNLGGDETASPPVGRDVEANEIPASGCHPSSDPPPIPPDIEPEEEGESKVHADNKGTTKKLLLGLLSLASVIYLAEHFLPPELAVGFLEWVRAHPFIGLFAYVVVYALMIIMLLPATPLTLGGGYVYKEMYGWGFGITLGTLAGMAGSVLGAVTCFVIGRYLMRERVRKWSRRYPLFEAIDIAVSDNGLRIMCMLYLTPVLPLGPVSYMCGTTSMKLATFALAKIASVPLMVLYVFIGASTGTIVTGEEGDGAVAADGKGGEWTVGGGSSRGLMIFGIVLSMFSIGCISNHVKKELYKIFDKQKNDDEGDSAATDPVVPKARPWAVSEDGVDSGVRARRPLANNPTTAPLLDEPDNGTGKKP